MQKSVRVLRKQQCVSTENLPEHMYGHINGACSNGIATTVTASPHFIWRHLYGSESLKCCVLKIYPVLLSLVYFILSWVANSESPVFFQHGWDFRNAGTFSHSILYS